MSTPVTPAQRAGRPLVPEGAWRTPPTTNRRKAGWIAAGCYLALAILAFRPILPWSTTHLPRGGIGDPAQMIWFLAYTPHALAHGLNPLATNLIDYPTGVDLANNTSVPLLGLLGWPVTASLGPVATFNVLVRLGLALSAISMYLVLGRWCRSFGARFIGGLTFGFGPAVIDQTVANTHLNLLFVPLLPAIIAAADELFIRQRWPTRKSALLLGLAASGQMLIAPELLSDLAIVVGLVLVFLGLSHPRALAERIGYALRAGALALAITLILSGYLVYEMIAAPNRVRGAVYPVTHLQAYRNTLGETLLPTLQQALSSTHLQTLANVPTKDLNELGGYLSLPFVCFLVLVTICFWRRRGVLPFAIGALCAYVLSLGEMIHLGTHPIWLPERVLTHLPLLTSTIPSRFSLDTLLAASALLAIGIDEWWSRSASPVAASRLASTGRLAARGVLVISVVAIGVSLAPRLPISERKMIWTSSYARTVAASVRPGGVVLAYPYPLPPYDEAMAWQAVAGFSFRLLGGYATVPGPNGTGQEWPKAQRPLQVQRYLAELELRHPPFPHAKAPISSAALCAFVARFHVTDIVVTRYGAREPSALSYLESVPHLTALARGPLRVLHVVGSPASGERHC